MEEQEEKLRCPKCNSTQLTADKRGYSAGKAVAGAVLTGGIGLLAGLHGKDKIIIYCMACGEKWKPAEYEEKKRKHKKNKVLNDSQKHGTTFIKLYQISKQEAEKYAVANKLFNARYKDVDSLYKKYRVDVNGGYIVLAVFAAIIIFIIYQCAS